MTRQSNGKARAHGRAFDHDILKGGDGKAPSTIPGGLAYGEMTMHDGADRTITGTSIFDPVLCELVYRWFSPPGGLVLDPFAGGSVRGIVASRLGREYIGIDLRDEQVKANRLQAKAICSKPMPKWITGDSRDLERHFATAKTKYAHARFVFSCPPYFDLERYSDDPADISNMKLEDFLSAYRTIIVAAAGLLCNDAFACFVVGDVRDADGLYINLPGRTIDFFADAGLALYNDAILITAAGSLPIRLRRQFEASRKLETTHQRVLVFVKGDPVTATQAIGPVEFGETDGLEPPPLEETPPPREGAESPSPGEERYGEKLESIGD
jgi:hypothetical protein